VKIVELLRHYPPVLAKVLDAIEEHELLVVRELNDSFGGAGEQVLEEENVVNFLQNLFQVDSLAGCRRLLQRPASRAAALLRLNRTLSNLLRLIFLQRLCVAVIARAERSHLSRLGLDALSLVIMSRVVVDGNGWHVVDVLICLLWNEL